MTSVAQWSFDLWTMCSAWLAEPLDRLILELATLLGTST